MPSTSVILWDIRSGNVPPAGLDNAIPVLMLYPLECITELGVEEYRRRVHSLRENFCRFAFPVISTGDLVSYYIRIQCFMPPVHRLHTVIGNVKKFTGLIPGYRWEEGTVFNFQNLSKASGRHGVFIARFQPFHSGHLEFIEACLRTCDTLTLIISKPEACFTSQDPLTGYERWQILSNHFLNDSRIAGILPLPYSPFKIENMALLEQLCAPFDTVFSINPEIISLARYFGKTTVTPEITSKLSATGIRGMIASGDKNWEFNCPEATVNMLKEEGIEARIRQLHTVENRK